MFPPRTVDRGSAVLHGDRGVVRPAQCVFGSALYHGLLRATGDRTACEVVVDSPPGVVVVGAAAVGPPAVGAGHARVELADHVDIAGGQHLVDPGPLTGQEAGVLDVALPVLDVEFGVRDVPVAADHE